MLDMARAILSKIDTDEAKLKLAGVHNALGEVATESGKARFGSPNPVDIVVTAPWCL